MKYLNVIIGYLICSAVVVLGMMSLLENHDLTFREIDKVIASGRTIVLSQSTSADSIKKILLDGGYMSDPRDASLASQWIVKKIAENGGIANLGELNSPKFKMPADTALARGGSNYVMRVEADNSRLGLDSAWHNRSASLSTSFGDASQAGRILVRISNADPKSSMPISGIPVRLKEYTYDTIVSNGSKAVESRVELVDHVLGFSLTDTEGIARFNVRPGGSYSVLPIQSGAQFGREKGTTANGRLDKSLDLSFKQQPHVLTPLSSSVYQALKADKVFVVRTPAQFKDSCNYALMVYLCGWAMLLLFFIWRDRRMQTATDYILVIIVMGLSGIGLLASYAINSPLTDKPNGNVMASALLYGLVAMAIVSSINFVKYYNSKSRIQMGFIPFDPIDATIGKRLRRTDTLRKRWGISISSGFSYLLIALGLIGLLAMFGTGPEGSDARVNLGSFQPSEISKYLIIIFIAAFFAENAHLLQSFSEKLTAVTVRRQFATVSIIIAVMLMLMLIYLKVLSDMGPALVLLITFILIYSMARRDFAQLLLGLVSFVVFILIALWVGFSPLMAAGLWLVAWLAFGWFTGRRLYESAIVLNMLVVVFIFGAQILTALGAESEVARMENRTGMVGESVWNNTVVGGDQVAQGLWSLSTGGITGMGLGKGNPSLVPACHTDMAFTSVGEMLGLAGLMLIIVCFVILVHRSLLIAKRAAQPFVMYLVMGVAIVTGVQFLFIVLGSMGVVPLTGISVPFLSYGRTSFIVTMAMFGIVVSASRVQATESQRKYANSYNNSIAAGVALFIAGAVVIVVNLIKYQIFERESTMIRPAYITNTSGERIVEYNPRIGLILNSLHSGNIYDRNGLLLATSSRDELLKAYKSGSAAMDSLKKIGFSEEQIMTEANRRRRRYYPFGDHTLFMLGDANTQTVYGYNPSNPIGYLAESRHFNQLRDLDIRDSIVLLTSDNFRVNRFIPQREESFRRVEYDYRPLIEFLNHGTDHNPVIEEHNARRGSRDLKLTIDARLQIALQRELDSYINSHSILSKCQHLRASVVVLNAADGDLLCAANYPLPSQDSIRMLNESRRFRPAPAEAMPDHAPLTERDLATTYATQPGSTAKVMSAISGLMKNADGASRTYRVDSEERIEDGNNGRGKEPMGNVTMEEAIRLSSNNYFINLVNIEKTYPELEKLYGVVGARVETLNREPMVGVTPYIFYNSEFVLRDSLHSLMTEIERDSYKKFEDKYMQYRDGKIKSGDPRWYVKETAFAWGQGGLCATPLTMARVASIVANNGQLAPTRYVLEYGSKPLQISPKIDIIDPSQAATLKSFMQGESDKHREHWRGYGKNLPGTKTDGNRMGGKTGTPERGGLLDRSNTNDAWYICFIESEKMGAPLAIALRLERTIDLSKPEQYISTYAVMTIADCILPTLEKLGYELK